VDRTWMPSRVTGSEAWLRGCDTEFKRGSNSDGCRFRRSFAEDFPRFSVCDLHGSPRKLKFMYEFRL
jgi:hypothetical protein